MTTPRPQPGMHARFLALALPNILSNLLVPLASAVDLALLGHLAAVRDLAGVALATVLFDYVLWTFGFLRMATTGMTAQARGRNDEDAETLVLLRGLCIAIGVGLVLVALQVPLREAGFWVLRGDAELKVAGRAYFDARIWGAPFTLANYALLGWLLGRERARAALWMSAIGHGANIALDLWFLAGLGLGAQGAGAATACSQALMFMVAMGLARDRVSLPQVRRLSSQVLDRDALRGFFSLGADITIRTLLLISTFAVFTNLAALMGTAVLAATAVLRQVVMLAAWFIDGYAFAVESLAGIFHGARETQRLRRLLRLAHTWALATGALFAAAFWFAPRPLLGILTNHASVLDSAVQQVGWLVPVLVFSAPAYVLDGYFLGLTAGPTLRRAMLLSVAVGFVPLAALAHRNADIDLLWASLAAFMLARTISLGRQVGKTLRHQAPGGTRVRRSA